MKTLKTLTLMALFALALAANTMAQNLVTNPGFESPVVSGYASYYAGDSTSMPGWTVDTTPSDGVQVFGPGTVVNNGSQTLQLTGASTYGSGGGVQQTLTTVIGATYGISIDVAARNNSPVTGNFNFDGQNHALSATSSTFTTLTWTVTATSTSTLIDITADTGSSGQLIIDNVNVAPLAGPIVTTQPQSITNYAGTTAKFSVAADGTAPLSYQWYFNTNTVLTGATNATLTLTNVQAANTGAYSVIITNLYDSATSSVAMLTVQSNLTVNGDFENPATSAGYSAGSTAIVAWTVDSTPPTGVQVYPASAFGVTQTPNSQVVQLVAGDGNYGPGGGIQQTISTVNGALYNISIDVASRNGSFVDGNVSFGGQNHAISASSQTFTTLTWQVSATSASTVVDVTSTNSSGTVQLIVDNVRVAPAALVTLDPVFSLASGNYIGAQSVTISCLTPGATIYYTTDGSTPTSASPVYSSAITIPLGTTTLRAFAAFSGYADSAIVSATYNALTSPAVPTWVNEAGGSWTNSANWSNNVVAAGSDMTADFSTLTLSGDTTVTLDGARTVGNLIFDDQNPAKNNWIVNAGSGGQLTLAVTNGSSFISNNAPVTIGVVLAGTSGLTKSGSNTLILAAGDTYTGNTLISDGTLQIGAGGATGSVVGNITNNAALYFNVNADVVAANNISGPGSITVGGGSRLHFSGTHTESGPTIVNSGSTLEFNNGAGVYSSSNSDHTVNGTVESWPDLTSATIGALNGSGTIYNTGWGAGTTELIVGANGGSGTFSGNIANGAWGSHLTALTKTGAGTQILTGNNVYSGATLVNGGTLEVDASLGSASVTVNANGTLAGIGYISGTVAVQNGGKLVSGVNGAGNINIGTLSLNAGSSTYIWLTKDGGSPASGTIQLGTGVTYGGTLIVTNITSDATPLAAGDTFALFNVAGSGAFTSFELPALPAGMSWDTSGLSSAGTITVVNYVSTPIFTPPSGSNYTTALSVSISTLTPGATIHYTLDGSDPVSSGTVISAPSPVTGIVIPANTNMVVRAYATAAGMADSTTESASYVTWPTHYWTNTAGGYWSDTGSWSNGWVADGSGITADFSTLTLPSDTYVWVDGARTVGGLVFGDAGANYNWNLGDGGGGLLTLNAGTNTPTIAVNNHAATIGVALAGTGGLTKSGVGTNILSGANTYTGLTTVSNGRLVLTDPAVPNVRGTNIVNSGATLEINLGTTSVATYNSVLTGNGSVVKTGAGIWWVPKTTFAMSGGTIDIEEGIIRDGSGTTIFNTNLAGLNVAAGAGAELQGNDWRVDALTGDGTVQLTYTQNHSLTFGVNNGSGVFNGVISEGAGAGSSKLFIAKTGTGVQVLGGVNTFLGGTEVVQGTLLVNGSIASAAIVNGGTLGGSGAISNSVTVNSGGTLAPGVAGGGTLTVNNNLTLNTGSTNNFAVNGSTPTNTAMAVGGTVTYGGVLNIVPAGSFSAGQTFTLFSGAGATNASNFASIQGSPGSGLAFSFTNGVLSVVTATGPSGPAPIASSYNPATGQLTLTWPAGMNWRLESQTNSLSTGLSATGWNTVSGTSDGNYSVTVNPAQPTVFYRLVYP